MAKISINKSEGKMSFNTNNSTMVPLDVITDTRLSWDAKGVYMYLISKPKGWQFSMDEIMSKSKGDMKLLQAKVKELEGCGYLSRKQQYCKDSQATVWKWTVLNSD